MIEAAPGELAINGGAPVRSELLPYGTQSVDQEDIDAVVGVLQSKWLTTGPLVDRFEEEFAALCNTRYAVAVSNGTAALHAASFAAGFGPGDEVIVPALTFAATANCVVYQGATPVFCDVDPDSLLIDPEMAARLVTDRTRGLIVVDYAGQPCDYDRLGSLAKDHGLVLIADACHAVGGSLGGRPVGSLADMSTFSFHPVKHMTTGEGGMITTDDESLASRLRIFRNHGIATDHRQRARMGAWFYEMLELGYNYRLSDIQCALGLAQMEKLAGWVARRQEIAARYDGEFSAFESIEPLVVRPGRSHAYHLYVVRVAGNLEADRERVFKALRAEGIGVNVHYIPVHLHPYYREHHGTKEGLCVVAEDQASRILTLPLYPNMSDADVQDVVSAVRKVAEAYQA